MPSHLKDRIQFLGHRDNVLRFYEAAAVYLQLSTVENLSLSVLDALRLGLPTVLTKSGGMPEQTLDGASGFLVPTHAPHEAALRIVQLLNDEQMRTSMGRSAQRLDDQRFSERIWEHRMDSIHTEALASGATSG